MSEAYMIPVRVVKTRKYYKAFRAVVTGLLKVCGVFALLGLFTYYVLPWLITGLIVMMFNGWDLAERKGWISPDRCKDQDVKICQDANAGR